MVTVFLLLTHNYLDMESQLLFVGHAKVLLIFKQTNRSQDDQEGFWATLRIAFLIFVKISRLNLRLLYHWKSDSEKTDPG